MTDQKLSPPGSGVDDRPEVLVLSPLDPTGVMAELEARFSCHKAFEPAGLHAVLTRHGSSIRGLVTTGGRGADADLIGALPGLEVIAVYGVGVDAVDLPVARRRGIAIINTPDVLTGDVADLAMGLFLSATRMITAGDRSVRAAQWATPLARRLPLSASGRKVGILGLGRIGRAIAHRLAAFDAEVSYSSRQALRDAPYRYFSDPVELARNSEVLFVTVPGGAATRGLVDRDVMAALGSEGLLINVSRGSVVDEPALCAALESGALGAAALDVFAEEPNVPEVLRSLPNVVLTPHIGSYTLESRVAMGRLVLDNLDAYFTGCPLLTPVT